MKGVLTGECDIISLEVEMRLAETGDGDDDRGGFAILSLWLSFHFISRFPMHTERSLIRVDASF